MKRMICLILTLCLLLTTGALADQEAQAQLEKEIDLSNDLAGRKGVVLMYGPGFSAPDGTVRVSLANLNTEDYAQIARRLFELLDEYYAESGIALANAA